MKGIFLRSLLQHGRNKAIIQTVNSYQVPAVSSTRSINYQLSVTSPQLFVHCSLLTVHCLLLSSFMAVSAQSKSNPNHTHANKRSRVGWFRNFLSKGDLNRAAYSHSTCCALYILPETCKRESESE
jgi:hypothetical protein